MRKAHPTPTTSKYWSLNQIMNRANSTCDECESSYFIDSSKMASLCPNCAHKLYGYLNCSHHFTDGVCVECGWNGQESNYVKDL